MLSIGVAVGTAITPLVTGLAIGTQAAFLFGVCALTAVLALLHMHRSTLTRYHVPALLLLALAVTGAFGTAAGYEQASADAYHVDYVVEPCTFESGGSAGGGQVTTVPEDRTETDFESLSPEAQTVFLQTLRNGGTYTTQKRPADLRYQGDTAAVNYVRYESTCYALVGDTTSTLLSDILFYLGTSALSLILLLGGWWSLKTPSFRFPTALLTGLSTALVAVTLAGPLLTGAFSVLVAIAATLAGYVAAEGALRRLEQRRDERFVESMTAEKTRTGQ